jgi:hypothetical protein
VGPCPQDGGEDHLARDERGAYPPTGLHRRRGGPKAPGAGGSDRVDDAAGREAAHPDRKTSLQPERAGQIPFPLDCAAAITWCGEIMRAATSIAR